MYFLEPTERSISFLRLNTSLRLRFGTTKLRPCLYAGTFRPSIWADAAELKLKVQTSSKLLAEGFFSISSQGLNSLPFLMGTDIARFDPGRKWIHRVESSFRDICCECSGDRLLRDRIKNFLGRKSLRINRIADAAQELDG